jgi:hypothetical protein
MGGLRTPSYGPWVSMFRQGEIYLFLTKVHNYIFTHDKSIIDILQAA